MAKLKMKSEYNLLTKYQMAKMQRVGDTDKRFLKRFARKREDIVGIKGMGPTTWGLLGEVLRRNSIRTLHGLENLGLKTKI